ncbi:uncharacterized protein [Neodiprion pinetum]|uniref:uncharacterized protein isoform X2 n=1 Tax=Neodiprion pinetum TaxID=441929 RepID=UPI0037143A22
MLREFLVVGFLTWRVDGVLLTRNQCSEELSTVDSVQGNVGRVSWPKTFSHTSVYSDPLCLSEDYRLIKRECSDTWLPRVAPNCSYVSPRKSKLYCPPGYTVVSGKEDHVCIMVSREMWANTCRFSPKIFDDVETDLLIAIFEHLKERGLHTTWLPVKRLNNFGPLLWIVPGPLWSSRFHMSEAFKVTYGDRSKGCLVLDLSNGFNVRSESCTATHPYLCIVEKDYFVQGACPPKYIASPIPGDERCFNLMKSEERIDWRGAMNSCTTAQIDNPFIEQLFSGVARKRDLKETEFCWIGGDGRYTSNTVAMAVNGESRNLNTSIKLRCIFCQIDVPIHPAPSISLKFYQNDKQLRLSVHGEEALWKLSSSDPGIRCFTDANGDLIRNVKLKRISDQRWTSKDIEPGIDFEDRVDLNVDIHKTVYRLKISDRGPGSYICEAHTVGGELLSTKPVIAYDDLKGNTFALGLEVIGACESIEKCDPTFYDMYKKLATDIEETTSEQLVEDIRLMRILKITPDGNVSVLCHVTTKYFDNENFAAEVSANAFMRSKRLFQLLAAMNPRTYKFIFLRNCDGCLRSVTGKGESHLVWPYTHVGVTAVSEEICLDSKGLPVHRVCEGSYMQGGAWSEPSGECASDISPLTRRFYEISRNVQAYDRESGDEVLRLVENVEQFSTADIYFLSKIIEHEAATHVSTEVTLEDISRISIILDKVMRTDKTVLRQSVILNSTNILLDSLGRLLDFASTTISTEYLAEDDGLISIVRSNLIIYISDPNVTNVTGLALIKNSTNSTVVSSSFFEFNLVPLGPDHSIENVAELGDVEVATWLPRNLLDLLMKPNYTNFNSSMENSTVNDPLRVVTTLFYDDTVFDSGLRAQNPNEVSSRVISMSVPGYGANLPFPIPLLFKPLKGASQQTKTCAFWDFDYLVLGHFPGPEEVGDPVSIQHGQALEVITVIGCVLSMVGVCGILITATVFKTWRKKPGSKVLIQLALALGLEKFVIGILPIVDSVNYPIPCIVTGALLHYAVLAEFSWMLVTAWLQFKRYVTVLGATRPPRFLLKAAAFAWGVPMIIVSIVAGIDPYAYMPGTDSKVTYCYVSGIAQYVGLLGPVIIVISLNAFLFVRVIHSILGAQNKRPNFHADKTLVIAQLRLGIMLFFLLGITWVFGLFAKIGGGLLFSYLFCITATLQGFVLFTFFIICDPDTRQLWYSLIKLTGKASGTISPNSSPSSAISEYSQRY